MKKTNFSEKMNSFLERKKKREENLSAQEEKKKKYFDKSNFTEQRNDELAKNYLNVIAGGKVPHRTDNIAHVMKYVEAHAEGTIGGTLDEGNESSEQYNQENGRETQRRDSRTRYNHAINTVNIQGNNQTEPTIRKESSVLNERHTNEHSLHNAINNPMEKMKKLRIKSTHRYLSKAEDDSYRLIKNYHREVDNCIEEIKSETFLKANLLKSEMESILTQVERLTQEALDLKWDTGDSSPSEKNSQEKMKNNHFYVTYYTILMELEVCEKFIPSSDNAVDGPQMNSTFITKNWTENTKNCILNEVKKKVDKKREDMKDKWECVQNLFTNLNEKIKKFICHFERKHEMVIKGMSESTNRLEEKMREKIFFSTEEASQIISTEMERGKQFFLDFLTHFNDYITKTYNYVYEKYHRCEYVFLREVLHEHRYPDVCCVYSAISQNYLKNLPTDKVLKRIIAMLEDNYHGVYARRVGFPPDQFFTGFLTPQGEVQQEVNREAANQHQQYSDDFYQNANQHYEEYLKRYEEIKTEMVLYREVILHTFFHLDNFATAVGRGRGAPSEGTGVSTSAVTTGGRPPWRVASKKAPRMFYPKWIKKAQGSGKENQADTTPGGANLSPKRNIQGEVKREDHPEDEPTIGENQKEDNLPEVNLMEDDPNGVTAKNDEHTHEIILSQICKNKNIFKKFINNILSHYNMLNLRDDYFLLSFFSILETLKSDILLMSSHVENKINESVQRCSEQNRVSLCSIDSLLRDYNSVVKKCLQCKDHLAMNKLLTIKDEARKKLESYVKRAEEEARTINEMLIAQSKRLWGNFFFATLRKAKVISAEGEALSLRRDNDGSRINDTIGEGKHINIKGKEKINTDDNERNIIRQLVGPKHTYTYDAENIWYHTYISYRGNMMGLLRPGRDIGAGLERSVKGKTPPCRETGKKTSHAAQKKENTIKTNIAQIRRDYIQQMGEAKRGNYSDQGVNPDGATHSLPEHPKLSPPDELLFNEDLLKQLFQSFTCSYYERFKEILFEHLLKAKMRSERESKRCTQQINAENMEQQFQIDEEKIKEVAIKLEEKFKANKKTFDNASKKLSQLVKEYEQVTDEKWQDYEDFKKNMCLMEKLLQEKTNDHDHNNDYDKFTSRYNQLVEAFKASFKSLREKLLCGEKKIKTEIKKVETYCTMLIRTSQTNIDLDKIEAFLQNATHLLLSIGKKRQDVENLFDANEYIFRNKFKAISSRSANRGNQPGPVPPPQDRQMIDYLITKEEIKNNLLIFYLLIYQIRVCIGQYNGQSRGMPYPGESKYKNPAYTSRASLKVDRSPRDAQSGKGLSSASNPVSLVSVANAANAIPPQTHQINLQDKFTHVQNCIYEIGTFRKIEKRYELDLTREDSIVSNFFLSRMIGPHLSRLVFSKATGVQESPDDYLTFGLFDKEGGPKGGKEQQAQDGSSCETVPSKMCTPKSDTKTNDTDTQRITPSGVKVKRSGKGASEGGTKKHTPINKEAIPQERNIDKKNEPNFAMDEIFRREYLDVKFFLYTCVYIIHLISNVVQTTPSKDSPKDKQPQYNHLLFISYDLSHAIYKNNLLTDNLSSKKIPLTDLMVNKKAMSSFVLCPDRVLRKTELIHLFKFEKEIVSELFERNFAQLRGLHSVTGNDVHIGKIHSEYSDDISTLATYLKVLLKKSAYFTFRCVYKRHESLCINLSDIIPPMGVTHFSKNAASTQLKRYVIPPHSERINTMQNNLLQKFKELNEKLKVTDIVDDTTSHVTKRKEAIKSLFHSYVSAIRAILTNHLSYLHDNLCNNAIFFVHVLSLLPAGSSPSGSTPPGGDPPPEKASAKVAGNVAFLKIHHVDTSAEYDLSDIVKKIDKAYGPTGDQKQADSGAKKKTNAEMLYLPYSEENLYIAKKLEHKMNKYGGRLYAHMAKALDEKKKEIIKIISHDVKEHRRYYE
ncbi:Uncharacterized protein PCOAH_00012450 [Plasmodium coatneyi]|uniref:Uncharacterized protein n=1 Tax=Plasmodium coatneyi TaxID=208452 RepID=A0A1B1DVM6_9APIC|nr:Uncharacterized protein PCOAH_00012450 [Plasmodium coatneyi]ANQ06794.1 Uncharacterized protein PCOAH_00012450 [Plasmodium coatneyi]